MKKANSIGVLIVAVLMFGSAAYGDQKYLTERDGNDWLELSKSDKVSFVGGFMASTSIMIRSMQVFHAAAKIGVMEKPPASWLKLINTYELFNISVGQLVDGLETFYKDYRNRNIEIVNAIYIVRDEINGIDPSYIEAQTRWLRKPKEERSRLVQKYVEKWQREQSPGPSPNEYKAKDGKVYPLIGRVPSH